MQLLQKEILGLIIETLNLEDIDPESFDHNMPLFGDGFGLDSIDALEIGAAISKRYGIKLKSQNEETQSHFSSVESLAKFVQSSTSNNVGA
ncbi:phosphopantetheine-binding protein [Pseudomonadota bacterium]